MQCLGSRRPQPACMSAFAISWADQWIDGRDGGANPSHRGHFEYSDCITPADIQNRYRGSVIASSTACFDVRVSLAVLTILHKRLDVIENPPRGCEKRCRSRGELQRR